MRNVTVRGHEIFTVADEPSDYWDWVKAGNYDHEWAIYDQHLRPEHTFLDLGAWVGGHSLYAGTRSPKRIVSVEPDPVAFPILCANVRNETFQLAITDHDGEITLGSGYLGASTTRANPAAGGNIGAWDAAHTCEVHCYTLRSFADTVQLADPLFIKMDVEGSEEDIIKDFDWFAEHRPTLYVETHAFWWKNPTATHEAFTKLGTLYKNFQPMPSGYLFV